jgi:PAS domain-containing protein
VVPLSEAGTCIGALEACWPQALSEFPAAARHQLSAVALPCARALSAGTPAADYSRSWLLGLLEGLHESVLYARPAGGKQADQAGLRVEWASRGFHDPAGRTAADVVGRHLAEAYQAGGLPGAAARVLASGQPERVPGDPPLVGGDASDSGPQAAVARLLDGIVIAWEGSARKGSAPEGSDEAERLAALLEVVQWLGNTGGWEEDIRSGEVRWTPPAFALFGQPPGQPVPLAGLRQWVPAQDVPAVEAFRDRLLRQGEPATAAFRIIRRDNASLRQLRASAYPVSGPGGEVIAVRGAYQDVSAKYHTEAAFTATREQLIGTEERARAERELVVRLQQAITPEVARPVEAAGIDVAARYRPASQGHLVGGDWYDSALLPGKNVLLTVGDVAGQ